MFGCMTNLHLDHELDGLCILLQGIQRLTTLHGCGFVHLRLHFKRGLHPFHPPTAELLWPRCQRPFAGALSSHPMIQLRSWDPWKPVKELILQLRVFMEVLWNSAHNSKPACMCVRLLPCPCSSESSGRCFGTQLMIQTQHVTKASPLPLEIPHPSTHTSNHAGASTDHVCVAE